MQMSAQRTPGQLRGNQRRNLRKMRNYPWWLLLLAACCLILDSVKAKPLISFGLGVQTQRPYAYPEPYYNNYYGPQHSGYYGGSYGTSRYPSSGYPYNGGGYPYNPPYYAGPYAPGNRYGALDIGIGALSLTPFLL